MPITDPGTFQCKYEDKHFITAYMIENVEACKCPWLPHMPCFPVKHKQKKNQYGSLRALQNTDLWCLNEE